MREPQSFTVCGEPKPAGSKRAFALKKGGNFTGRVVVTDACKGSRDWKTDVSREAERSFIGEPFEGPIKLILTFTANRPKSHFGSGRNAAVLKPGSPQKPATRPDVLKLARGVEDALTGICWKDDSQITTEILRKRFGRPGVVVEIAEDDDGQPSEPFAQPFTEEFKALKESVS